MADEISGSQFRSAPGIAVEHKPKSIDEKLKDASKMYEKLFMSQMVKAMKSTVPDGGFIKQNAAEKLFREEMDAETVNNWANQKGGVGLADMIYQNLVEKYGVQMGIRAADKQIKGPIAFNDKSQYSGPVRSPSMRPNELSLRFDRVAGAHEPDSLLAPWNGTIIEKKDLGDGIHLLGIEHDDGLSGRMVFRGTPRSFLVGHKVQGGQEVGLLSPEAKSFFWNLNLASTPAQVAAKTTVGAENKDPAVSE